MLSALHSIARYLSKGILMVLGHPCKDIFVFYFILYIFIFFGVIWDFIVCLWCCIEQIVFFFLLDVLLALGLWCQRRFVKTQSISGGDVEHVCKLHQNSECALKRFCIVCGRWAVFVWCHIFSGVCCRLFGWHVISHSYVSCCEVSCLQ